MGLRKPPLAFTEQGVAMLSSVLSSERAIMVNIQIIRVFTKMRELLATHKDILQKLEQIEKKEIEQDDKIMLIFEYLKQFEEAKQQESEQSERTLIGFKTGKEYPVLLRFSTMLRKQNETNERTKVCPVIDRVLSFDKIIPSPNAH